MHTPGPWRWEGPDWFMDYNILPPNDTTGALAGVVNNGRPPAEVKANAVLFAVAPELLAALRPFANYACDVPCDCHNCRARAAIAKATRPGGEMRSQAIKTLNSLCARAEALQNNLYRLPNGPVDPVYEAVKKAKDALLAALREAEQARRF